MINIIVATDINNGIGINNQLPWHFKSDMKFFKTKTIGKGNNAVVMGKNTFLSIKKKLPNRDNLILSSTLTGNNIFKNINDLLLFIQHKKYDDVWIIGGETIYRQFLNLPGVVNNIYVTRIQDLYNCDAFFTDIPNNYIKTDSQSIKENDTTLIIELFSISQEIL
jgi:dihydrofolate reductase